MDPSNLSESIIRQMEVEVTYLKRVKGRYLKCCPRCLSPNRRRENFCSSCGAVLS